MPGSQTHLRIVRKLLSLTNYLTVSPGCSANYGKDSNREGMRCVCIMSLAFYFNIKKLQILNKQAFQNTTAERREVQLVTSFALGDSLWLSSPFFSGFAMSCFRDGTLVLS